MEKQYSVIAKSAVSADSILIYRYGMPFAVTPSASALKSSVKHQPKSLVILETEQVVSNTTTDRYLLPQTTQASLGISITAEDPKHQLVAQNSKAVKAQYFPVILQFLAQQFTNPLTIVIGGSIGLVIVGFFASQLSGSSSIKLELDLEVSPGVQQIEKAPPAKSK